MLDLENLKQSQSKEEEKIKKKKKKKESPTSFNEELMGAPVPPIPPPPPPAISSQMRCLAHNVKAESRGSKHIKGSEEQGSLCFVLINNVLWGVLRVSIFYLCFCCCFRLAVILVSDFREQCGCQKPHLVETIIMLVA